MGDSMEGMVVFSYDPEKNRIAEIRFHDGRILVGDEVEAYLKSDKWRLSSAPMCYEGEAPPDQDWQVSVEPATQPAREVMEWKIKQI